MTVINLLKKLFLGASNCVVSKNTNKIPKSKVIKVSNTYNFLKKLAILKEITQIVKLLL